MWISTCWLPLVYGLKRYVNFKEVTSIIGYKQTDTQESDATLISLNNLSVINDLKNDYGKIRLTFNMNNRSFVYVSLSEEFNWPREDLYESQWIKRAFLIDNQNKIDSCTDVTYLISMYAGPSGNFYNSTFDFNWIPEVANSSSQILSIYDHNEFCYKVNLKTNTEINDTGTNNLLENICGIKLYCRSADEFESL